MAVGVYDWVAETFFGPYSGEGSEIEGGEARTEKSAPPAIFVAFDLETTGLDNKKERIVEIGGVKFDRRGPIGRFSAMTNPGIPISEEASRVNGITDEMLADKPSLDEVLPDFLSFIGDAVLVAHNAPFDCGFVDAALADRFEKARKAKAEDASQGSLLDETGDGEVPTEKPWAPPFPALPNKVVDTRIYAKEAFPGRWKYNLQELAKFLGINAIEAHRAEDDARVCMELFIRCAEKSAGKEVETFGS